MRTKGREKKRGKEEGEDQFRRTWNGNQQATEFWEVCGFRQEVSILESQHKKRG